jgi:hypothetical protein
MDTGWRTCAGRKNQLIGRPCAICGHMTHFLGSGKSILQLAHNGDPYGGGFTATQSDTDGVSWFYRGDIGPMPRSFWRRYARLHGYTLREVR